MLHKGLKAELAGHTATQPFLSPGGSLPDRIYPSVIPQKVPGGALQLPALVYELSNVERQVTFCGVSNLVKSSMRIDCYSNKYDDVKELAAAVRGVLQDYNGSLGGIVDVSSANLETEFDVQDFEPGLYRVTQSWTFWHVE